MLSLGSLGLRVAVVAGSLLAASSVGGFFGYNLGASSWKGKVVRQAENSSAIIMKKEGELQQCRSQVDEYNRSNAALSKQIADKILQDQEARKQAAREAEARERDSRKRSGEVLAALKQIREDINNGKFDPCTSTLADPDFIGLLNDTLARNRNSGEGD